MRLLQYSPIRKLIESFRNFHKDYFSARMYISVALFITMLIALNYWFDVEDSIIDSFRGSLWRIPLFFGAHGLAWYGVVMILKLNGIGNLKLNGIFWLKSAIGILLLSIDRSVLPFISRPLLMDVPVQTHLFYHKLLNNAYGWLTIVLMLFIVKLFFDRKDGTGLYGLRFRGADIRLYLILLAAMVPVIYVGSLMEHFTDYYPLYKKAGGFHFSQYYGFSEWISKVLYEFFYLTDFVNTELFFRGFLVIGLSKLMGKNVILPMVATYAVLHFGKPLGETISSVFGGYILGVIALYSRNIWGGVFIHGGIAFLMEVFAFWRQ